jgi:hypothetical protein
MRTTIDISDELYRTLKTRAAIRGVTLRVLVQELIEQGLNRVVSNTGTSSGAEARLPVAIAATGTPIKGLTSKDLDDLEVEDYLAKLDRSS